MPYMTACLKKAREIGREREGESKDVGSVPEILLREKQAS